LDSYLLKGTPQALLPGTPRAFYLRRRGFLLKTPRLFTKDAAALILPVWCIPGKQGFQLKRRCAKAFKYRASGVNWLTMRPHKSIVGGHLVTQVTVTSGLFTTIAATN
jgi:hypothetical protein